jgi:hypothetical protein
LPLVIIRGTLASACKSSWWSGVEGTMTPSQGSRGAMLSAEQASAFRRNSTIGRRGDARGVFLIIQVAEPRAKGRARRQLGVKRAIGRVASSALRTTTREHGHRSAWWCRQARWPGAWQRFMCRAVQGSRWLSKTLSSRMIMRKGAATRSVCEQP